MHTDPYSKFSKKVNAAAPYLPFGEMRNLVMNHDGRRRSAFAAFFRYAAGFALLLLIGAIFFLKNLPSEGRGTLSVNMSSRAGQSSLMNISKDNIESAAVPKEIIRNVSAKKYSNSNTLPNNKVLNVNPVKTDSSATTLQSSTVEKPTEQSNPQASNVESTVNAVPSVTASLIQASDQNLRSSGNWSAFIAGGSMLSSNNFSIGSMLGAVGLQYRVSGSSSLVVELRHSGFTQNKAGLIGSPYDTTVTAGGQIYKITIGTPSTLATTSTVLVNSLDLGYRYVLNPNNSLSPSAELLAGASTSGFVSLEAIGLEYRFATSLTLDMSARAEQLFSPSTSPLGLLGLEATLGFQW